MAEEEEEQEQEDVRNKFLGSLEFLAIKKKKISTSVTFVEFQQLATSSNNYLFINFGLNG